MGRPAAGTVADTSFARDVSDAFDEKEHREGDQEFRRRHNGRRAGHCPTESADIRSGKAASKAVLGSAEKLMAALDNPDSKDFDESVNLLAEYAGRQARGACRRNTAKDPQLGGRTSRPTPGWPRCARWARRESLDNVDALIYALTDPDPLVVREANEALLRIGRSPTMVRLPANPTPKTAARRSKNGRPGIGRSGRTRNLDFQSNVTADILF